MAARYHKEKAEKSSVESLGPFSSELLTIEQKDSYLIIRSCLLKFTS